VRAERRWSTATVIVALADVMVLKEAGTSSIRQ